MGWATRIPKLGREGSTHIETCALGRGDGLG
jgi:hypothetical protein